MKKNINKKELPKSCKECLLEDLYSDFPNIYCSATNELINDGEDIEEGRHSSCPLAILYTNPNGAVVLCRRVKK